MVLLTASFTWAADRDKALVQAAQRGDATEVRAMLAAGANSNATDKGHTALMHAALGGNAEIVETLLGAGARCGRPRPVRRGRDLSGREIRSGAP